MEQALLPADSTRLVAPFPTLYFVRSQEFEVAEAFHCTSTQSNKNFKNIL